MAVILAIINHPCLASGDTIFRLLQMQTNPIAAVCKQARTAGRGGIAQLYQHIAPFGCVGWHHAISAAHPVHFAQIDFFHRQGRLRADNHLMAGCMNGHHIKRGIILALALAPAYTQTAPLANGVIYYPVMLTQRAAINMFDKTRLYCPWPQFTHHITIAAIGHKTDILAIRLVTDR